MTDLIVFSVENNRYAIDIENVQRIIQAVELTTIPNSHECIDGMMSYEDSVIKVVNFRKLTGLPPHEDEFKPIEDSSLKFLFYDNGKDKFAVKVDNIDDISHVESSDIMSADDQENSSDYLKLSGVLDLDSVLINIIKTIDLPN